MKKFFALFAIVVLFSAASFAATWNSGNKTGTFTAYVYCMPTVDDPQTSNSINIFEGETINGPWAYVWNVTGPNGATYTPSVTYSTVTSWSYTLSDAGTWTGLANIGCATAAQYSVAIGSVTGITANTPAGETLTITFSLNVAI